MGDLLGDDGSSSNESDILLSEQIQQNNAELERKKKSLFAQRLSIEKTMGAEQWNKAQIDPIVDEKPKRAEPSSPLARSVYNGLTGND